MKTFSNNSQFNEYLIIYRKYRKILKFFICIFFNLLFKKLFWQKKLSIDDWKIVDKEICRLKIVDKKILSISIFVNNLSTSIVDKLLKKIEIDKIFLSSIFNRQYFLSTKFQSSIDNFFVKIIKLSKMFFHNF